MLTDGDGHFPVRCVQPLFQNNSNHTAIGLMSSISNNPVRLGKHGTAADRNRLDSFLRRCIKQGFWSSSNTPSISAIAEDAEDTLFNKITRCDYYILQSYLSDRPEVHYNLRERHHNKVLIPKTADLNDRDFLVRNVYRGIY